MLLKDLDITTQLRQSLPVDAYLFNPSIAHIINDLYIISVRSYIHDTKKPFDTNPILRDNPQHPWGTDWAGTDDTYILPVRLNKNSVTPITKSKWPLKIPVQDLRIYRFMKDDNYVMYILTFNERYEGYENMLIKGGDSCDDFCYLINWGYLVINTQTLDYKYLPGEQPLCMNISNPIEKNWSLWQYKKNNMIYLLVSYALSPIHSAFSFIFEDIKDGEIIGGTKCRMITNRPGKNDNVFGQLEKFYDNNLYVSLSTPSYEYSPGIYQSVGHLKVRIDFVDRLAKSNKTTPLANFVKKYTTAKKIHYNPNYIYLMFIYRFRVDDNSNDLIDNVSSGNIQLTGTSKRINAKIISVTPAFVNKVDEYDYFLNFPSGMVLTKKDTIISYGNGDATSHLLFIDNKNLETFLIPADSLKPGTFKFMHSVKRDGKIILK